MWDRLLSLFRDTSSDEIQSAIPDVQPLQSSGQSASSSFKMEGPSTHIGYNYLKGLDGENEDSSKHIRRFHNLNKLLRGRYDGKITATDEEPQSNIRGEDTE